MVSRVVMVVLMVVGMLAAYKFALMLDEPPVLYCKSSESSAAVGNKVQHLKASVVAECKVSALHDNSHKHSKGCDEHLFAQNRVVRIFHAHIVIDINYGRYKVHDKVSNLVGSCKWQ